MTTEWDEEMEVLLNAIRKKGYKIEKMNGCEKVQNVPDFPEERWKIENGVSVPDFSHLDG